MRAVPAAGKMKNPNRKGKIMDLKIVLEEFEDYLAPTLDTYEQAVYLYIFRHGRLQGKTEAAI